MKEEELVKRIRAIKQETGAVGLVDPEQFGPRQFLLRKADPRQEGPQKDF